MATLPLPTINPKAQLSKPGTIVRKLLALPLIFQRLHELGRAPEAAADELLATVKIYNTVPSGEEEDYRAAIAREYAAFCQQVPQ